MKNEIVITVEATLPGLGHVHRAAIGLRSTTFHTRDRGEVEKSCFEPGNTRDPLRDLFNKAGLACEYEDATRVLFAAAHPSPHEEPRRRRRSA